MNLNDIKQNHKYIFIGTGVMVLILLIILFASIFQNKTISYTAAEERMKKAGIEYFEKNGLPNIGEENSVTLEVLVNEKRIKSFSELVEDETCIGSVHVINNNGNFLYTTELNCSDNYNTVLLSDKIKDVNSLNTGDGLYDVNDDLVFRGEKVNNFISFSDVLWRITKINNDGSIEMIHYEVSEDKYVWDDRYNVEKGSNAGINDFTVSRIKDSLDAYYNSFSSVAKSYIVPTNICIGANTEDASYNGARECSETIESYISMIQLNQFAQASLDENCKYNTSDACVNYNYLSLLSGSYWTITADASNTYKAFKINEIPTVSTARNSSKIRPVITITNKAVFTSGTGTQEDPYTV